MSARVTITLLGAIRIEGADLEQAVRQPKRLALLGYLAAAGPGHHRRRDELVALLWPELDQERARLALRQALHAIRRCCGRDVVASDGTESVALVRHGLNCDLWELQAAAERGDHQRVLQLYAGELLRGLHVSGAPMFEQWVDRERMRIRGLVQRSAWAAAEHAHAAGAADDLLQAIRVAVAMADTDEAVVQRAMALLSASGQRTAALRLNDELTDALRREFELDPSAETRALAERIRREPPSVPAIPAYAPAPPPRVAVRQTRRAAAFVALGLLTTIATTLLAGARDRARDPRLVLVEETRAADAVTADATALLRAAIARLADVRVVATAENADAGTIVRSSIRQIGDSSEARAEIIDRGSGVIRRTVAFRSGATTPARMLADTLADRVRAAIATALYPGWGAALSQPVTYDAYRLFVDGMRSIVLERHETALASFSAAHALDSTFTAAALLAGIELYQLRRYNDADSVARMLGAHRARLRPIDAHLYDWLVHSLDGDRIAAREAMRHVTVLAPDADLATLQLAIDCLETGLPREALTTLRRINPESEFGEGWAAYWATRLEALHMLRDHGQELVVARDALRRYPHLRVLIAYEMRALAALGRTREIDRMLTGLDAIPPSRSADAPALMQQVALELAAHGHPRAAEPVLARARAWYAARPAADREALPWQTGAARTAYLADDRPAARARYDSLLRAYPRCLDCVGAIGVLDARSGDAEGSRDADSVLRAADGRFLFGRHVVWRARIAAASGDAERARILLTAAYAAGYEFDVMTHADIELGRIDPDDVYRRFARLNAPQ